MKNLDKTIISIDDRFHFYKWLTPVNANQEKDIFFSDKDYNPQFKYSIEADIIKTLTSELNLLNRNFKDSDSMIRGYRGKDLLSPDRGDRERKRTPRGAKAPMEVSCASRNRMFRSEHATNFIEIPDTSIGMLYRKLLSEYLKKISLIANIGLSDKFTDISINIYGNTSDPDIKFSENILDTYSDDKYIESVEASVIRDELEKEILANNILNWKVITTGDIASKVTVKPGENTVYVKDIYKFFPSEANRLKVHEISVHLFRAENGGNQEYGIFKRGLAGYLEAEEGLAVYFENKKGVSNHQQMKIYAGRLKAVELAKNNSFCYVFKSLRKWFPEEIAYRLCERSKRGLTDTSQPGALTKDIHYITGYRKIKDIIDTDNITEILFAGKIGIDDIPVLEKLLSEGILKKPLYLP